MRILVLGGTGFLGPNVVRYLTGMGHHVAVFHTGEHEPDLPPHVEHVHSPLAATPLTAIPDELQRMGPDVVLHMVPIGQADAEVVMEGFTGNAGRVVAISSQDVYRAYGRLLRTELGPPEAVPITEDSPLREKLYPYRGDTPRSADDPQRYLDDYDKILVERAVMGDPSLPGTVLRLPRVYGPGDRQHRIFPYVKRMDDQRPAILLNEGLAGLRLSRAYAENVAWAIALAIVDERAAGRIYNVAETETSTEAEWVEHIGSVFGWKGKVVPVAKERLPVPYATDQHSVADSRRIREELEYAEVVPLDEAIKRTIEWERAHPPEKVDPADFDYEAEDAILRGM